MNNGGATLHRLYRSRHDRMIAGVAGGIGQYLGIEPVLVRLGFVILALASGVGLLAYIALAIIMPLRPEDELEPAVTTSVGFARNRELAGYLLLAIGVFALAGTLGVWSFVNWAHIWPIMLIAFGVLLLIRASQNRE